MNIDKNYYDILGLDYGATPGDIKKKYRELSKTHHPDRGGDEELFKDITEAYSVFSDEKQKKLWDKSSPFGKNWQKISLFKNLNKEIVNTKIDKQKFKEKKDVEDLNIHIEISDDFSGKIEYERWVMCPKCGGTGTDLDGKIVIKDQMGNVIRTFESDDGCDFCEGTGKNLRDQTCVMCQGQGKTGSVKCKGCQGNKRIKGKQKLSKIKFPVDEKIHKIDSMGNSSVIYPGKSGHLYLFKKTTTE